MLIYKQYLVKRRYDNFLYHKASWPAEDPTRVSNEDAKEATGLGSFHQAKKRGRVALVWAARLKRLSFNP